MRLYDVSEIREKAFIDVENKAISDFNIKRLKSIIMILEGQNDIMRRRLSWLSTFKGAVKNLWYVILGREY